jgi:hypothetical protein
LKNQEILKELKSFPKEYQPDNERQKNTLKGIMDFYDEYEKKGTKTFSFQKWQVAAAGIAAVILASFLFLPNILHHERNSHHAAPPHKDKFSKFAPNEEKSNPAVTPSEQFHSKELENVKAISIVFEANGERKITDHQQIESIVDKFKQAKLMENQNIEKEKNTTNHYYLIKFQLKDGLIEVQYWPDENGENFIDIQQRSWWRVEGLNPLLDTYQSSNSLTYEQATNILTTLYPDIQWDKEYSLTIPNSGPGNVFLATGITPTGELLQIEIDQRTGKVLKEEKPESTAEAVKAAQTFFHLVGTGNYQAAWDLIHPKSKVPNSGVNEEKTKKSFSDYFKTHQTTLKKINSAEWTPYSYKFEECMCTFEKEVLINATLSDGTKIDFHVIKDDNNQWKLYWSLDGNKLE